MLYPKIILNPLLPGVITTIEERIDEALNLKKKCVY